MLPAGMILGWVAYTVGSYGWVLIRGWDISFRSWVSPLNPYQWPAGGPGPIPDNQLFPTGAAGPATGSAPAPATHVTPGSAKQGLSGDLPSTGINAGRR